MELNERISLRIDNELKKRIHRAAQADDRDISYLIIKCVEAYLPNLEKKYGLDSPEKAKK